eukprot:102011_1
MSTTCTEKISNVNKKEVLCSHYDTYTGKGCWFKDRCWYKHIECNLSKLEKDKQLTPDITVLNLSLYNEGIYNILLSCKLIQSVAIPDCIIENIISFCPEFCWDLLPKLKSKNSFHNFYSWKFIRDEIILKTLITEDKILSFEAKMKKEFTYTFHDFGYSLYDMVTDERDYDIFARIITKIELDSLLERALQRLNSLRFENRKLTNKKVYCIFAHHLAGKAGPMSWTFWPKSTLGNSSWLVTAIVLNEVIELKHVNGEDKRYWYLQMDEYNSKRYIRRIHAVVSHIID